jgi:hypothetical protein
MKLNLFRIWRFVYAERNVQVLNQIKSSTKA